MVLESFLVIVTAFGYLGLFAAVLVSNATILLPVPGDVLIFAAGGILNPILVGIVAGIAATIGELTAYYVGLAGRIAAEKKGKVKRKGQKGTLGKAEALFNRYGFWAIPVFAFTPLPMDVIGLFCGGIRYNIRKFFLGVLIGKVPRALILAIAGGYAIPLAVELARIFGAGG